ncbi:hypothetical protein BKA70DRAFT_1133439 [Coprinopsis sp. MPI-PUGE-AT-0042]|nr:hypothetical protein BKA70DRAFT_1133439 [Coprinopsis sp. MPI-PUGE-AT-0042]
MQNPESDPVFISRITGEPVPCPSDYWLRSPAWIDGASNPPRHYYTREEMDEAAAFWGPRRGILPSERGYQLDQAMARISPTPISLTDTATRTSLSLAQIPGPPLDPSAMVSAHPGPVTFMLSARSSHPLSKKFTSTTKIFTINIAKTARKQLVNAAFLSHSLSHAFKAGDVSGPAFRMHWTGSAGGKTNAASILTDDEFEANKAALLRKPKKPEVSIEILSTDLEPFRIQEVAAQVASLPVNAADDAVELAYGTKVPQVASFSTQSQLHGLHIMELKQKYKCEKHLGEHGEQGCCYITPSGDHIRLNLFRLRIWAAAWASGDATKHEPPNVEGFDGARNGESGARPRGRNGPRAPPPPAAPAASNSNEMIALLVGALLPNLGNGTLGRKHARDESASPRKYRTPPRVRALTAEFTSPSTSGLPPSSPFFPSSSSPEADLEAFLESLLAREGIDFTAFQSTLAELDLTPDILPHADTSLLVDLLGSTIGKILKLKLYAESWSLRRNGK